MQCSPISQGFTRRRHSRCPTRRRSSPCRRSSPPRRRRRHRRPGSCSRCSPRTRSRARRGRTRSRRSRRRSRPCSGSRRCTRRSRKCRSGSASSGNPRTCGRTRRCRTCRVAAAVLRRLVPRSRARRYSSEAGRRRHSAVTRSRDPRGTAPCRRNDPGTRPPRVDRGLRAILQAVVTGRAGSETDAATVDPFFVLVQATVAARITGVRTHAATVHPLFFAVLQPVDAGLHDDVGGSGNS